MVFVCDGDYDERVGACDVAARDIDRGIGME